MDHLDPVGVGVVQVDQLPGLVVGVGDQHVGGRDDLLLADHAGASGSGVSPSASAAFLTFAMVCMECTSGTPQRSRASAADLAGEPVVRVHQVVVAGRVAASARSTSRGERAQLAGSSSLVSPSNGPGGDVPDRDAVGGLDDRREGAATVARVKMSTSMPRAASRRGELDDVDVHAAGVAGARLVERGGVQADHRARRRDGPRVPTGGRAPLQFAHLRARSCRAQIDRATCGHPPTPLSH